MQNKTQDFSERRGSGDQNGSKVKVPNLNPGQLYYTLSCEGKKTRGVKLELMWASGPKNKMVTNH